MIKTFKDFAMEDLDVFFNLAEFGEEHELDGLLINVIIVESNVNDQRKGIAREQLYASQEVFKQIKTLYVKTSDFYIPKVDSELELDGEYYYVEDVSDEKGVIRIVISANES